MQRILIIGISGSGKSTLAKQLQRRCQFPVHHLDLYFWLPEWKFPDPMLWMAKIREISAQDKWIIEGNYESALEVLIPRADTIIYLHMSRPIAFYRVWKRYLTNWNKDRDDRPEGCKEKVDWEFMKYIWRFNRDRKPLIDASLRKLGKGSRILRLNSQRDIEAFLQSTD